MKVRDYVRTLNILESKRAEFENLINGNIGVFSTAILQRELENAITDILALENLELEAKPQIIRIGLADEIPMLEVGQEFALAVNYTLTNGTLRGFGLEPKAEVVISDIDNIYNNEGFITSIEANNYTGLVDISLKLTRTVNGFDVFDDNDTQGLQVVLNGDTYSVVDTNGEPLGINFTEEGTVPGDDFRVSIIRNQEPLTITVNDTSVVEVEGTILRALQAGATQINIEGDGLNAMFDVEVKDIAPVIPEEPEPVDPPVDNIVKTMSVKTGSGNVEAVVTDGNVAISVPFNSVTESFAIELDDVSGIPADSKVVMNFTPEGGTSDGTWVDYGTIAINGNVVTVTPIGANGTAGHLGTVIFKLVNADGSDVVGLDLPVITLTVSA